MKDNNSNHEVSKKRVLVMTPHYEPDFGPSAPIFTALCEDLAARGYDLTVICGVPHYGKSEIDRTQYSQKFNYETRNNVKLIRIQVIPVPKKALWKRLIYHASYNLNVTRAALKVEKPDVIIADSPILWSGLPLLFSAIFKKIPFIYIVSDIYPDVLEKLGVLKSKFLASVFRKLEDFYYRKSRWISVLSKGFYQNLVDSGVNPEKLRIIPVCVDLDFFRPRGGQNHFKTIWGLEDKFIVLYAGNVGHTQGLEYVVDAAKTLEAYDRLCFVIVGQGATLETIKHRAASIGVTNVQFHNFVPYEEVPFLYSMADVCLISMKPELVIESVPSKTYSIMASGKPIIATVNDQSEVENLIKKANCGLNVKPENTQSLADAILRLYRNPQETSKMGKNSRLYAELNFSRSLAADAYQSLIDLCS